MTFFAGDILYAADLNIIGFPPSVIAARSTNQSINNASSTPITFPTEVRDTDSMFTAGGSSVTIASGRGGLYHIVGWGSWAANATGFRQFTLLVNAVQVMDVTLPNATAAAFESFSVEDYQVLTAGDVVTMNGQQSSGGALNVTAARLSVVRVGD